MQQNYKQFKYEIVEPNDDINNAVIEKTGMSSARFTLASLQAKQLEWSKEKRQLEGQITIEQAKVDNIAHHHPWVLDLTEQQQYEVWMYYEAMKTVNELRKQADMRIQALDEYQTEKEYAMKAIGFRSSPIQLEDVVEGIVAEQMAMDEDDDDSDEGGSKVRIQ